MLCDVAAGGLDGLIDSVPNLAPWDYLGGYLACVEAGAVVRDANGEELVTDDPNGAPAADRRPAPPSSPTRSMPAGDRVSLDLDALLVAADRAARAGGEIVRAHFGAPPDVREKAPGDWVTAADVASEDAVRAVLERETGLPVFGEEAGGERADTGWLVDPLDGTSNFVHGLDAVGVSVGLVADGEPVVGVVHAPLLDRTYAARKGGGAFRDERRIHVSERTPEQAIVATGFPVPAQGRADAVRAGARRRAAHVRGPAPGRRRQPRPVLDRGGRVRRLLRAPARPLGRRGRARSSCGRRAGSSPTGAATPAAWLAIGRHPRRPARRCTRCWREIASSAAAVSLGRCVSAETAGQKIV